MRNCLISALALAFCSPAAALEARVQTTSGWIEGEALGENVVAFRGIPYAAPPTGDLRWRPPAPHSPWADVRAARVFSPDCPQSQRSNRHSEFIGAQERGESEDCLALNIWTAAQSSDARLPVMMWIHGGGFNFGSGALAESDGEMFARAGVVLVSINYRLGPLGFLVHPELTAEAPYASSGNYGLLDQMAALQWIKENIAAFGGDPERVTIFGESAGSGAVNILQASPLARGLFHRAIGESTSQMDYAAGILGPQTREDAERAGLEFAAAAGADSLATLRRLPAEGLQRPRQLFWPLNPDGHVLPQPVYDTFASGKQNDVPTLVGWNAGEGINLRVPWIKPETPEETAAFSRLYRRAPDAQIYTDVVGWQMRSWAGLQTETGESASYVYFFDQTPPASEVVPAGPIHAAEIVYVFQSFDRVRRNWTQTDRRVGAQMAAYWVNFARSGDPNGPGLPRWPVYSPQAPRVMVFAPRTRASRAPRSDAFRRIDDYFRRRRP